nr:transient receptor potential cation channel subfamily A member 1 [Cacopsylla chinensis]
MEVFLQYGESIGCSREEMISLFDAEGNLPLHSAVHGGDFKAVELCLKSGAKISTQQFDLSTPVHLACSQGALEIVRLMFNLQPGEKLTCLNSTDAQKMTPMHCAAMFDRCDVIQYLIDEGADLNVLDKEKRSPLLLAASRGGWKTVLTLVRNKANINLTDMNRRNILHLLVLNGGHIKEFAEEMERVFGNEADIIENLLNERDKNGCSPLHYASREGHIVSLENLINLGACINLKNNSNESPLHLAARYGRFNTVKKLLSSERGSFIINECDGEGLTPLHIASQQGHTRVVQLLLNRGSLLHRDHNGRNPLHLAAMSGYTDTMILLNSVHSHLLDQVDKDGNTSLHLATMENKPKAICLLLTLNCKLLYNCMDLSAIDYAIYYKFPEAALAMVTHNTRGTEIMSLRSDKHPCVTLALVASMPRVFESVQDKSITKANCKKDSKSFYIKYNFSCLQCVRIYPEINEKTGDATAISKPIPLPALNAMVQHDRVELLAHPLSQKYLEMKWNAYGKYFHMSHLLFYSVFLIFITLYSYELMRLWRESVHKKESTAPHINSPILYICGTAILTYILISIVVQSVQIYQQKWHYLFDPTNIVATLLFFSATVMIVPLFSTGRYMTDCQISFTSLTVFLSWLTLLLNLQRFDQVGIYVVMFLEILQTLIKVLIVFSILIVAFGLAFYILLSRGDHLSFKTVPMSLLRTFTMMLGEIDFIGTYVQPYFREDVDDPIGNPTNSPDTNRTGNGFAEVNKHVYLPFPVPAFIMLGIFMILMPILLMNLLIGLAVGDIESVRRNAQLKRLAMQVVLHTELERNLPKFLVDKVDKMEIYEYPNECKGKLGFLDFVIRKWFCNPFTEDAIDMVLENNKNDVFSEEIDKLKQKLNNIETHLDHQFMFLRLIVHKMDIKTESDERDEGIPTVKQERQYAALTACRTFSPIVRQRLSATKTINKSKSSL